MGRVTIGRSPGKDIADMYFPISRFLPILEDYAHIWDVDIIAQWPQRADLVRAWWDAKIITINFFQEKVVPEEYTTKISILGYALKDHIRCAKEGIVTGTGNPKFFDFTDDLLAHTGSRSVNIDFDFLRTCWDAHEEVLRIILAWGLTHGVVDPYNSLARGDRFAEYITKRCTETVEDKRTRFTHFQRDVAKKSVKNYEEKLCTAVGLSVEHETAYVEVCRQLEELIALDLEAVDDLQKEQFETDFDRLRNLNGIAKVWVVGGKIFVVTRRLEQTYPPPSQIVFNEVSKIYDVGSIRFFINPSYESYAGIEFNIDKHGAYKNAYLLNSATVCLGTNAAQGGMNMALGKLLSKYKIPDVVALILTFFRFVNAQPVVNADFTAAPLNERDETLVEYTDEDWGREKEAYTELLMSTMRNRGKKEREKILDGLTLKQASAAAELWKCWTAATELERFRLRIQARAKVIEERALALLEKVEKNPAVLGFDMEHGFRIWFMQRNVFMYPSLLWIQENGTVRLISFLESHGSARNHAVLWEWSGNTRPSEFVARGEYAEVLGCVMQVTANWLAQVYSQE